MKLLKKVIEKDGKGFCVLIPELVEDLWHLYHIISPGDQVTATAIRKIQKETTTGSITNERLKMTLQISVEQIDFDPSGGTLRISGKNVGENKFVKLGQYHTLEIEANRKLTILKAYWDSIYLQRISDATDIAKSADLATIVLVEGLAHLSLMSAHMTVEKQKIEMNIPKKRQDNAQRQKVIDKFFEAVLQGILRHIDFKIVKCVIIASPGFVKEQFLNYILKQAQSRDLKDILSNKNKFILCYASSGHQHSLKEALSDPNIAKRLEDTKAAGEVRILNAFFDTLKDHPNRAVYGPKHVMIANEHSAIQTLLITDELFRSMDLKTRKQYVALVDSVKENGGEVFIFSSLHVSGQQLQKLTGIAAMLRYPLEIDDIDTFADTDTYSSASSTDSEGEDDDENNNGGKELSSSSSTTTTTIRSK